ncbi:Na+/H+ antiporter subunit G [Azospirillum sp. RWY-5-1]|uniref:Na+/H+ antiporter subunit G n=1 Tax=Azospirillum oleiclasticum TaxID=2735135 RepID=A0ABX2TG41_9PROT|nr:monovalent cation/H(+) antiporter subunit G [Azospirillum oleiclasticum]NYZ14733.1 Na+/H+ antiporter subunit G [Azospirillum oleiclasticum]NYZ22281.1 Na+/H+ antiporter subunit G [Azospirillum oleiclasticum]
MAEILAAILLLAGSGIVLIAAVGVARLPDAYLRMHAATKAGVVGAGTVLLGAAVAFGSPEAWLTVLFALACLLLTTPIASHLLGRAAYVSGAPLWHGTQVDHLEGVLDRRPAPSDPIRTEGRSTAMPTIRDLGARDLRRATPTAKAPTAQAPEATRVRRILAVLPPNGAGDTVLGHAVSAARVHGAAITGLSVVDLPRLAEVGPMPVGGGTYARMMADTRLRRCRERMADALERFEADCRRFGLTHALRHEEGDAGALVEAASAAHDLVLVPATRALCDDEAGDPLRTALGLLARGVRPVVVAAGPVRPVRRVAFCHDGSARAARTLSWLAQLGPWPEAEVRLVGLGEPSHALDTALSEGESLLVAHGRRCARGDTVAGGEDLLSVIAGGPAPEVVVIGNAGGLLLPMRVCASAALRALHDPDRPVVLG